MFIYLSEECKKNKRKAHMILKNLLQLSESIKEVGEHIKSGGDAIHL